MVLDFSKGLFQRPGLYDESGDLSERWGQGDNTVLNLQGDEEDDNAAIHTNTTGKTVYITQITIATEEVVAATSYFYLKDGGAGGTTIFRVELPNPQNPGDQWIYNFKTPLKFSTDVYLVKQSANDYQWNITGWEE